ncbi:uncharacterized protein LOC142220546 [Haematobia irritans]|uniref:uncharacterized protein LOC142220546 n=1 Tax=Haematobia irritans TaxID=7368 RepID=UPI003F502A56
MSSSTALQVWLLILLATNSFFQVVNASVFGIGSRQIGDQLLLKDVVKTPSITLTEETVITFNYAIPQPITYVEMLSDEDIYVSIDFSYQNDLVNGTIRKKVPGEVTIEPIQNHEPFDVLIEIYGYVDIPPNMDMENILNKGHKSTGILKPRQPSVQKPKETLSLMREDVVALEEFDDMESEFIHHHDRVTVAAIADNEDGDDGDDEHVFSINMNKIIQLGERQPGDHLLYQADQTSPEGTESPTDHTVVFYYIDNNLITFVEFTIVDHYIEHPLTPDYEPPTVAFEKISPHTLKAIVTDHRTKSLFVQMQIYGYEPNDKPVAFQSYLTSGQLAASSSAAGNNDLDALNGDVEHVSIQLPLTSKRRTTVHFNSLCESEQTATVNTFTNNHAYDYAGYGTDGTGQLVICNWLLITMMTTVTFVIIVGRHMKL